jgi:HTH-type transcriptional regulator, transcriptional repressor of NAD biosynthesis genes
MARRGAARVSGMDRTPDVASYVLTTHTPAGMKRGLVLGKFLPYHAGHAHLIRTARDAVDELVVLVCSIARQPIPGEMRHRWVAEAHPDCRVIHVAEEVPQAPEESAEFWPIWADLIHRYAGAVDQVFTSEAYGDELARRLGATHTCVDPARRTVPISGTAIRSDPLAHWEYLPPVVRPHFVERVAILGPESVGKTTLAQNLAESFGTTWAPEFGRAYCESRNALALELSDFDAIAMGQLKAEEEAARRANRVLICDTDLATTCTWSDMVAGGRTAWLSEAACRQRFALTILLSPDGIAWVNDGTRVLGERRQEHFERLQRELERCGRSYLILNSDSFEQRLADALALVRRALRPQPSAYAGP